MDMNISDADDCQLAIPRNTLGNEHIWLYFSIACYVLKYVEMQQWRHGYMSNDSTNSLRRGC